MTICIAAAAVDSTAGTEDAHAIVLCNDLKTGGPLGSAETALKRRHLTDQWYALTSGSETEIMALDIVLKRHFRRAKLINHATITSIISDALVERKKQRANEYIGGRFGISYDDLLNTGKLKLPDEQFRDAVIQITNMRHPEFIIAGFELDRFPFVCQTSPLGIVSIREDFAVVGEGEYVATSVLLQRSQSSGVYLPQTIYNVFEAKKYTEKVPSVGPLTSLAILKPDGLYRIPQPGLGWLAGKYSEFGPQRVDAAKLAFPPGFLERQE